MTTVETSIGAYMLILPTFWMLMLKYKKLLKVDIYTIWYLMLIITVMLSFIANINNGYVTSNVKMLLIVTFSFFVVRLVSFKDFVKYFTLCMKYIVIISLVVYVGVNYFNITINLPIVNNVNGASYYNGLVFFVFVYSTIRNTGVFWEPGLFASFIIFAMIFEISFKNEKINYVNLIILFIGLLSTRSTAGIAIVPFIIVLHLTRNAKFVKSYIIGSFLIICSLITYINLNSILLYLVQLSPKMFGKFLNQSGSYENRLASPIANIDIFASNPFFGVGIGKIDIIVRELFGIYQTSTSTYYLASIGIGGIVFTLAWVFGIWKLRNQSILSKIIILIVCLLILNKEPHTSLVATYCIMFYFLKDGYGSRATKESLHKKVGIL
ncbi:hypothetical protein AB4Z29_22755 [Paenibacillus sp. 2TAB23]|uniref:hypothetical protein n=1 Tax=Paenibacillus sp. 2TAB23 TaxID=3233004 RepID=UPI003F97F1A4